MHTESSVNAETTHQPVAEHVLPLERSWIDTVKVESPLSFGNNLPAGQTAALRPDAAADAFFSTLELRDRVVIMLLFDQVVREDQVELAWQLWRQMNQEGVKEPLWRVLTLFPDLDRELVYAEAARVYGFEEARISRGRALALIKEMHERISPALWEEMVELFLVPVSEVTQKHSHRKRMVFATPDPTRPDVHRLLPALDLEGYELRYARESEVVNLLIEAFPRNYNHLNGISGVTRDFLASVYPDDDTTFGDVSAGIKDPVVVSSEAPLSSTDASSLSVFENVLVDAVHRRATDVCLLPHANGHTDIFFQIDGALKRYRVVEHIPPKTFLTAIKSSVIREDSSEDGKIQKRLIQRWVNDALVRFRVSTVPANEAVHAECVVVRVFA